MSASAAAAFLRPLPLCPGAACLGGSAASNASSHGTVFFLFLHAKLAAHELLLIVIKKISVAPPPIPLSIYS